LNLSEQTKAIQSFIQTHPNISKLSGKEVSDFYVQLIDCLVDHNHQYYIEIKPIISDKEYDELFDYLKKIEEHFPQLITSNSPTQWLIGQVSEWFKKAEHETKLLSLENTYNAKDLKERDERVHKLLEKNLQKSSDIFWNPLKKSSEIHYIIEPKFDGISIELIYKQGIFTQAITRWDGMTGEDVTENVRTIKNIPKKVSQAIDVRVRWEIVMPKSVWKEINKEREENGETPFANTRNAAAWSIKLLDPKEVAKRGLLCYVYDILQVPDPKSQVPDSISQVPGPISQVPDPISQVPDPKSQVPDPISQVPGPRSQVPKLIELGLPVFPREKDMETIEKIIELCEDPTTKKELDQQDSEFDGLVIKVKDEQQREIIWTTDHHPRRAVAYKFPAQLAATQILSVDFQVGRTWIITPVANLQPVQLSGAKLQRVSLHNFDFIKEKDIHLHDRIRLQRSGEVIPYIVSVITDRRTTQDPINKGENEGEFITPPERCPSCEKIVTQQDMHYYCTNPRCPEKMKQQIQHFVSKNCMDIQGIGESIVDILVDNKIIETVADIYKLTDQTTQITLRKFPWIGDKKITEIIKGIEESKHKALRRLLNWLGISHVGKKMAQDLASQIQNVELRMQNEWEMINLLTNEEFLRWIYWIGEKSVETITAFFSDTKNLDVLEQLKNYGVNMDPNKYNDLIKASEAKWSFSITWSFTIPREKIAEYFQKQGYIFDGSPTKTTDFILIGDKAGSKKTKAQDLWITIYEGRETITQQFPFLKGIQTESSKPKTQSLF